MCHVIINKNHNDYLTNKFIMKLKIIKTLLHI
ncbi:hypothetical protein J2067_001908 [Erwinia rhapontici]|nr:hypothetical protein [Erwinia rhapontici]